MKRNICLLYSSFVLLLASFLVILRIFSNGNGYNKRSVNVFHIKTQNIINDYNLIAPFLVYTHSTRNSDIVEVIVIGKYPDSIKNDFKDGKSGMYISSKDYLSSFWYKIEFDVYTSTLLTSKIVYDSIPFVYVLPKGNVLFFDNNYFILCNYYINQNELFH